MKLNNRNKNWALSYQPLVVAFLILIVLFTFNSCKNSRTGNFTLTMSLKAEGKITEAGMNSTIDIIKKRLTTYGIPEKNITISFVKDEISLKVENADSTERIALLASTTGNLEFWETYELSDVYSFMTEANTKASVELYGEGAKKKAYLDSLKMTKEKVIVKNKKGVDTSSLVSKMNDSKSQGGQKEDPTFEEYKIENPLFAILTPNTENNNGKYSLVKGPVVGFAAISDTAKVNKILSLPDVKMCFPRDIKFAWTMQPFDDKKSLLKLLALKITSRDGKAVLDGTSITSAKQESGQDGNAMISMEMNTDGAHIWKRFTAENVGKSIAFVIDNYVYTFPMVNAEIPNGRSQISGKFTEAEAEDLATVLTLGKLPYTLKILKSESIELKK
jgi:SecD/SecF fusion protein